MSWFKIAQKLILAFIVIAMLIGVVGFIGIYNMNKVNSNGVTMHDYNLETIKYLTTIKQNFTDIRADLLELVYQNKYENKEALEKEINSLINENSLLSEPDEEIFLELKENIKLYLSASNKVINFVNENNIRSEYQIIFTSQKINQYQDKH